MRRRPTNPQMIRTIPGSYSLIFRMNAPSTAAWVPGEGRTKDARHTIHQMQIGCRLASRISRISALHDQLLSVRHPVEARRFKPHGRFVKPQRCALELVHVCGHERVLEIRAMQLCTRWQHNLTVPTRHPVVTSQASGRHAHSSPLNHRDTVCVRTQS